MRPAGPHHGPPSQFAASPLESSRLIAHGSQLTARPYGVATVQVPPKLATF